MTIGTQGAVEVSGVKAADVLYKRIYSSYYVLTYTLFNAEDELREKVFLISSNVLHLIFPRLCCMQNVVTHTRPHSYFVSYCHCDMIFQ